MRSVLTVVGGLPATGKSTIAVILAEQTATPYLRVDRIEQAIVDWSPLDHPVGPVGYAVAHAVALEQLRLGQDVIVECVNPGALTRDAWVATAAAADASLVEVEVSCPDLAEHRRRVESRPTDVRGLTKPDWEAVAAREYEPWTRQHLTIDSTTTPPPVAARRITEAVEAVRTHGMFDASHLVRSPDLASVAEYAYAAIVNAGARLVFTAGACPLDEDGATVGVGDVRTQASQVIANLETSLRDAGASFGDVVRTTIYVASSDRGDLGAVWEVVRDAFAPHDPPSTLLGVAALGYPDQLVEMEAVAALEG